MGDLLDAGFWEREKMLMLRILENEYGPGKEVEKEWAVGHHVSYVGPCLIERNST